MTEVYVKTKGLQDTEMHYCPGCTHGTVHKLIAEVLEEMNLLDTAIGICPVGCAVFAGNYFYSDFIEAAHGRAPAVATGVKRLHPDQPVFTYQGDGDLASIGAGEIVHAAMRGEKFTTIFINNAIYGMTGGQMAPTTLIGQRTTTSPLGRAVESAGNPIRVAEMLSTLDGLVYAERVCVTDIPSLNKTKKALRKAFELQMQGAGFTFVEILAACPTNWGMTIADANQWLKENMASYYPLGVIKDSSDKAGPSHTEGIQGAQDAQGMQDAQGAQDVQGAQDTQGAQDVQGAQDAQDVHEPCDAPKAAGKEA